jgi:hypothetical protein
MSNVICGRYYYFICHLSTSGRLITYLFKFLQVYSMDAHSCFVLYWCSILLVYRHDHKYCLHLALMIRRCSRDLGMLFENSFIVSLTFDCWLVIFKLSCLSRFDYLFAIDSNIYPCRSEGSSILRQNLPPLQTTFKFFRAVCLLHNFVHLCTF